MTNAGTDWNSVSTGLQNAVGAHALAIDPTTPTTIYAITGTAFFRSTDSGAHWTAFTTRLGFGPLALNVFVIDPTTPTTLYAGTFSGGFGVYKSTNAGSSWLAVNQGITGYWMTAIAADPQAQTIYVGTVGGAAFRSTDGGVNWTSMNDTLPLIGVSAMTVDPLDPSTVYAAGSSAGPSSLLRSRDGGRTWTAASAGLSGNIVSMAINPTSPSTLTPVRPARPVAFTAPRTRERAGHAWSR